MNINIVASSSSEINNKHIFSLLKNRDKKKKHIIIAPDRSLFSLEQRLFEETGEKCFFDVNIISLSRLSKLTMGKTDKNILTKQSGVALVKKILEDNKSALLAFGKATAFMGFATSLFETICFYKSCNIKPSDMYVDDSMSFSNLKQKDIKLVYSEYEKYLETDYTDSFNQLQVFANSISKDTFPNTIFYFIGFDDFTRLMYDIILKISRFSEGIYISCTYGKGNNNSNIFSNKVYYDMIDLFKSEGLDYKINKLKGFDRPELNALSNNLLGFNPSQCDLSKSNISIRSFNSVDDEIVYTLADIYSHALLNQKDFSNYTIVVPNLTEYKSKMVRELNKYQIPYYIDESMLLIENCFIRLLFDVCNLIAKVDYKLSDFTSVIKSPLLNFRLEDISNYDNYLRRISAVGDMCLNADIVKSAELIEFIDLIKTSREAINSLTNYAGYIEVVGNVWSYIHSRADNYLASITPMERRIYEQVLTKCDGINRDILNVFGEVDTNFANFLEIYKSYYESMNISLPPISSNTLFIADFNTSYVSNVENLYILGNNEGKLPKMQLDNGLVSDDELKRLPNGNRLTPTIAMLNSRKVFKLYELIFKYKDRLVLSYLNNSFEGKEYPNNLINSISKIGNLKSENQSGVLDAISRNYNLLDINNVIFNNLTPEKLNGNLIDYISDWEVYNHNLNYREVVSSLYSLAEKPIKEIVDAKDKSLALNNLNNSNYFSRGYASVSQIETFNMCPYMHFAKYGLRLRECEESKLKPNDIGNIIHEVLSKIVPFIITSIDNMIDIQSKAKTTLEQVLLKEEYKVIVNNKSNTFVIKALFREMERIVLAVANEIRQSNFKPKYYEYRFDNIVIDNIKLKGFIDRIDEYEDGFIIIDYKTGDNQFKNFNDVVSGKKLQLLVYAKAFEVKSNKQPKGAFYMPLSNAFGEESSYRLNGVVLKSDDNIVSLDRGLVQDSYKSEVINLKTTSTGKIYENNFYKNLCLSQEDFNYLLNFGMQQVRKSINNIKLGEITPRPLTEKGRSACDYCSFKGMCNYNKDNNNNVIDVENINKLKDIGDKDGGIQA